MMGVFDFGKVKETVSQLAAALQSLRAERETLLQRREELEAQPACKEDLLATLDSWICSQGDGRAVGAQAVRQAEATTAAE